MCRLVPATTSRSSDGIRRCADDDQAGGAVTASTTALARCAFLHGSHPALNAERTTHRHNLADHGWCLASQFGYGDPRGFGATSRQRLDCGTVQVPSAVRRPFDRRPLTLQPSRISHGGCRRKRPRFDGRFFASADAATGRPCRSDHGERHQARRNRRSEQSATGPKPHPLTLRHSTGALYAAHASDGLRTRYRASHSCYSCGPFESKNR